VTKQAYIFIGPPGSGKGSLSKLCTFDMGWQQLSTGNLCRKHISEQTSIGKEIDFIIRSGKLISDDIVGNMVDQWLAESMHGDFSLILDGFPRNVVQAHNLLRMVNEKYKALKIKVVRFIISDEVAIDRICNRYICQNHECQTVYSGDMLSGLGPKNGLACDHCSFPLGKRGDDDRETVKNRLKVYRAFEQDMLACLNQHECIEVNVERPLREIFETFKISIKKV
jgi:adenylate kinase